MAEHGRPLPDRLDLLLRGDRRAIDCPEAMLPIGSGVAVIAVGTAFAGAVVGASDLDRPLQIAISATKLPVLMLATGIATLPLLIALHAAAGRLSDWTRTMRIVMAGEIGFACALASLSPLLLIAPAGGASYDLVRMIDVAAFAIALSFAGLLLRRLLAPSVAATPSLRWIVPIWLVAHVFTGVQVAWMLRPFVGSPDLPARWFRPDPFTNAWIELARLAWRLASV